jgi:hypothetical protein
MLLGGSVAELRGSQRRLTASTISWVIPRWARARIGKNLQAICPELPNFAPQWQF